MLGLGSYQTAWTWLYMLRRAMVRPGRDMLNGCVEVYETYIGGKEEGTRGRKTYTKSIVAIAIEVHSPKGFGRVRLRQVPDVSASSLVGFVKDVVATGSVVVPDAWTEPILACLYKDITISDVSTPAAMNLRMCFFLARTVLPRC